MEMNEKKNSITAVMEASMAKIREMVDSNSVIGEPITTPDGVTLIPVSRVSLGFGSGGSTYGQTSERFGGGGGAGITITPIAFIVVNNGEVSIKHISTEEGSIERTIGMIPDVVNSVTDVVNKFVDGKGKKTEENLEGLY